MTPLDRDNAATITGSAQAFAEQLSAVLTASAAVIGRRVQIGASAFGSLDGDAAIEADTMVHEKAAAALNAWSTVSCGALEAGRQAFEFATAESMAWSQAMAGLFTGGAGAVTALQGFGPRLASHCLAQGAAASRLQAAALEPYLTASSANAKRLALG